MVKSKTGQRFGGLFLFAVGVGFTLWSWHTLLTENYYYPKVAALFPAIAVCGLCVFIFPLNYDRLHAEHGVDKPTKFVHYPLEWKLFFFLALAAGLINWFAISHTS